MYYFLILAGSIVTIISLVLFYEYLGSEKHRRKIKNAESNIKNNLFDMEASELLIDNFKRFIHFSHEKKLEDYNRTLPEGSVIVNCQYARGHYTYLQGSLPLSGFEQVEFNIIKGDLRLDYLFKGKRESKNYENWSFVNESFWPLIAAAIKSSHEAVVVLVNKEAKNKQKFIEEASLSMESAVSEKLKEEKNKELLKSLNNDPELLALVSEMVIDKKTLEKVKVK